MATNSLLGLDAPQIWDTDRAFQHLKTAENVDTKRTAERRLHQIELLPTALDTTNLRDEFDRPLTLAVLDWQLARARKQRDLVLLAQLSTLPDGRECLHCNDARGARYWRPLESVADGAALRQALQELQQYIGKPLLLLPHGRLVIECRKLQAPAQVELNLLAYAPVLDLSSQQLPSRALRVTTPHLKRLEDESIHIIREAVAEAENPAMLYSVGKDSSVMLHLARKAFYPATPPFPLVHVDTRWKFQEMYMFRDHMARYSGMDLLVHINPEAVAKDINPFEHGSALHTDITKTEGLKQALDKYKFDVVFGGARRDEEKSRAKERIFSFRTTAHRWDPKNQRPELWNLYNTRKSQNESIRVFPLSNWTELDIWQYIYQEGIPVVPLYFAKERPVVIRDGLMLMVDDARFHFLLGEEIQVREIRFRTLGCYPLTGGIESKARSVPDIILELLAARSSERQGRAIDSDSSASMEKKKKKGYF